MGMISTSVNQRPSIVLREEQLIDDEPGLWNLILDNRILANAQRQMRAGGSLSSDIERKYAELGIRRDDGWQQDSVV